MIKFSSRKFRRGISFKFGGGSKSSSTSGDSQKGCGSGAGGGGIVSEIQWELRPGGMLVQKRESNGSSSSEEMITVRVSTVPQWHDISIESTSTFGELKTILALVTNLEPREQRLLFKGKERGDEEYLHMVGVRDKDKVLLLEDPAIKEMKKLHSMGGRGRGRGQHIATTSAYRTISV